MPEPATSLFSRLGKIAWNTLPVLALIAWLFFGAFVFHLTEDPHNYEQHKNRLETTTDPSNSPENPENPEIPQNRPWNPEKWSFWGSFAFVLSLDLSVGFPHRVPESRGGQAFAIIHFLIALPLVLRTIYVIGDCLSAFYLTCHRALMRVVMERRKRFRRVHQNDVESLDEVALYLPIWLITLLVILLLLLLASFVHLQFHQYGLQSSYAAALYLFLLSLTTVGYLPPHSTTEHVDVDGSDILEIENSGRRFDERIDILLLCLAFLGLILLYSLIRLAERRVASIQIALLMLVEERYKRALVLGKEGEMATHPKEVKKSIAAIVSQQSLPNRFWYIFMSQERYQAVERRWLKFAHQRTIEVQTKESSFEPRMYGIGSSRTEFRKSRDDVNSLVAMLDFNLRPFGSEVRTHETIREN